MEGGQVRLGRRTDGGSTGHREYGLAGAYWRGPNGDGDVTGTAMRTRLCSSWGTTAAVAAPLGAVDLKSTLSSAQVTIQVLLGRN